MDFDFLRTGLFIKGFFTKGHERSIKAKKNIISSFVIQGISIGISLIMIPITLSYVNASQYGIWLTLSSIVTWFSFFDIGLTQGLRNKFAEARAKDSDSSCSGVRKHYLYNFDCHILWFMVDIPDC